MPKPAPAAWWRPYWVEILALGALITGVATMLGGSTIRSRLMLLLSETMAILSGGMAHLDDRLGALMSQLSLSDVVGAILVLAALALIVWRVRLRVLRDPALTTMACPRCGGALHRIHRRSTDRLSSYVIPVRRYRCGNGDCHWKGLRVVRGHKSRSRGTA